MNWRNLIFESEPEKPVQKKPVTPAPSLSPPSQPLTGYITSNASTAIYQRLKDATSFESTPIGQVLNKYLAPLLALPIDEKAKYKAAMAQAQAQENITAGGLLGTIDGLKDKLAEEHTAFEASILDSQKTGIEEKLKQQEDLKRQITALTVQCTKLDNEISMTVAKIGRAKQDFAAALSARTAELDEQKARFTDLLK